MVKVNFVNQGMTVEVPAGTSLLEAAARAGVPLEGDCGGKGTCGKCRVKITAGPRGEADAAELKHLSPPELAAGWVLACRRKITANCAVAVPSRGGSDRRKISLDETDLSAAAEPDLVKILLTLPGPSVKDQTADLERLLNGLPGENIAVGRRVLADLPRTLREAGFSVTAVLAGRKLVAVEQGDTTARSYGLAFDIGTTTLVGSLMDLRSGAVLAVEAATNPQNVYGADVISRITHAAGGAAARTRLQEKVIGALNEIIGSLCKQAAVRGDEIYEVTAVGNTTMSHLFLGIDPTYLAPAPFVPAWQRPLELEAAELGLAIHPGGRVTVLPNIAGYVGSDTVGVILATRLDERRGGCTAAIDIGTNGEIVLAAGDRLLACSTAAGPAFEGAQIRQGMRAAAGAVEAVEIEGDDVRLKVIGGTAPRGICGSGLIDAAAALLQAGVIEESGRFADPGAAGEKLAPRLKERLRRGKGGFEFILARAGEGGGAEVTLAQGDLRELQLAKGAIYAGLQVLLHEAGLTTEDLDQVLLAGAFGNYIRRESALAIGLLPALPVERIVPVGNAAGQGARMALISRRERRRAFALPGRVEHIELSARPDFQDAFIKALSFNAKQGMPRPYR